MIDDLDRTIRELLTLELPRVQRGEVEIAFQQPNRDWKRDKAALNFFLYDTRQNPTLRQHQRHELLDREGRPQRANQRIPLQRTPLRLDCFYMITAWSSDPLDEHRLLTEVLVALARYPILNRYEAETATVSAASAPASASGTTAVAAPPSPANGRSANGSNGAVRTTLVRDYLVGTLRNLRYEIPTRLAEHDVLTNPAEVWGSLENSMKSAFSYVVTLPISPWLPMDAPIVETARFRIGPAEQTVEIDPATGKPTGPPTLQRIQQYEELLAIGGVVLDALRPNVPASGVEVQIKETGLYTRTDELGRFRFPGLWQVDQEITLVVEPQSDHPTEKTVRVPHGHQEDYNVTINLVRTDKTKKKKPDEK